MSLHSLLNLHTDDQIFRPSVQDFGTGIGLLSWARLRGRALIRDLALMGDHDLRSGRTLVSALLIGEILNSPTWFDSLWVVAVRRSRCCLLFHFF